MSFVLVEKMNFLPCGGDGHLSSGPGATVAAGPSIVLVTGYSVGEFAKGVYCQFRCFRCLRNDAGSPIAFSCLAEDFYIVPYNREPWPSSRVEVFFKKIFILQICQTVCNNL